MASDIITRTRVSAGASGKRRGLVPINERDLPRTRDPEDGGVTLSTRKPTALSLAYEPAKLAAQKRAGTAAKKLTKTARIVGAGAAESSAMLISKQ